MTALAERPAAADAWLTCGRCRTLLYGKKFTRDLRVCPECGWHAPLTARDRVETLLDEGSWRVVEPATTTDDPLVFHDQQPYRRRRTAAADRTGMTSAVLVAQGRLEGRGLVVAVMDFRYMGGSLGAAEGEAVTTAAEVALADGLPLVVVTASGGARMQEGALSLMQMAKTSAAFRALDEAGLLTVSVVTDPTYGGVAASFATLSDVVLAEPAARMGFAGPRVIAQTIRQELPEGFQTAEYLLANGLIDAVRPRSELRTTLARLVGVGRVGGGSWAEEDVERVLLREPAQVPEVSGWDAVTRARHSARPTALDHISYLLDGFVELHGDREGEDCPAVVGGVGRIEGRPVAVVAHQKGHDTAELVSRNFGMPSPAGYRKSVRLMRLAEKLGLPVLTLIDTPGAYPGVEAEERGQANAIAESLRVMSGLRVPSVAVVTGEGGSGGALALGVADSVLLTANGTYSVISPEGCASILWHDATAASRAAEALRVDARSLLEIGVVDAVVPEPEGGSHTDPEAASDLLRRAVLEAFRPLLSTDPEELVAARGRKFRAFGSRPHEERT